MSCRSQDADHLVGDFLNGDGDVLQGQLAGFQFGIVQNVVHNAEEIAGAALNGGQILRLGAGGRLLFQLLGEADNAVQRGSELMRHIGQEFRFCPGGHGGIGICLFKGFVLLLEAIQRLAEVVGGRIHAVLHFVSELLHGAGHGVDIGAQPFQLSQHGAVNLDVNIALSYGINGSAELVYGIHNHAVEVNAEQQGHQNAGEYQADGDNKVSMGFYDGAFGQDINADISRQGPGIIYLGIGYFSGFIAFLAVL